MKSCEELTRSAGVILFDVCNVLSLNCHLRCHGDISKHLFQFHTFVGWYGRWNFGIPLCRRTGALKSG